MYYPKFNDIATSREMISTFSGLDTRLSCKDGFFRDMKNITADYYPILSCRNKRGIMTKLTSPQGIFGGEDIFWVDQNKLYKNGIEASGISFSDGEKQIAKMGAYLVILPDKKWYNTETGESGNIENTRTVSSITIDICDVNGKALTFHDEAYYESHTPNEGDYMMVVTNGVASLKVYNKTTASWVSVVTPYLAIKAAGIGEGFKVGDAVKISVPTSDEQLKNLFVNDDGNGYRSSTFLLQYVESNAIIITGIISQSKTVSGTTTVSRTMPDISFLTECQNRLWGCASNGHEIYCCKLGDVTNWNVFTGIATDSYSATVGSDGEFTGAITYNGYPYFFKEKSFIRVTVSSVGAHQIKESQGRGVQAGSSKSLKILNEILYYKANDCVVAYTGAIPAGISDVFGTTKFTDAVAGTIGDKYYISMKDDKGVYALFAYDIKKQVWVKEDATQALDFVVYEDDLLFIDKVDNTIKSIRGTLPLAKTGDEASQEWEVVSGNLGYSLPDKKYVSRINVRAMLEVGTQLDMYFQYDSDGVWEHKLSMYGKGTKTFTVPIIPKRCDHFAYKIKAKGSGKIFAITRTIEQGSDESW